MQSHNFLHVSDCQEDMSIAILEKSVIKASSIVQEIYILKTSLELTYLISLKIEQKNIQGYNFHCAVLWIKVKQFTNEMLQTNHIKTNNVIKK